MEKVEAILSLIIPLFVSTLQRTRDLAYVMEVRGCIPSCMWMRYKQLKMEGRDYILFIASVLAFTAMVVMMLYA